MKYPLFDSTYIQVEFLATHKALLYWEGGVDRIGEVDGDWWPHNDQWEYHGGASVHSSLVVQLNNLRERYINDLIVST